MSNHPDTSPSPFAHGYTTYGGWIDREVTPDEIRAALPDDVTVWDGRDGTKPIIVTKHGGLWRFSVIARPSPSIPLNFSKTLATAKV